MKFLKFSCPPYPNAFFFVLGFFLSHSTPRYCWSEYDNETGTKKLQASPPPPSPGPRPPPPPNPPCKGIQDSLGFWIPRRGFRIQSIGFRILCQWDFGFLEMYSGFQSPGFCIPQAKISWIRESGIPYMGRKNSCNEIDQLYFLFSHSGTFLLIYVNEYNIAVQAFALQGTVSDPSQWMEAIKKAQV